MGGAAPALSTIVITQSLRYWLLAAWALSLAACLDVWIAASWFIGATLVGLVRGRFERALARRAKLTVGAELTAIATITSIVWSIAPILAWRSSSVLAELSALTMLISGYVLVITQFRHLPRRAAVVGAPYGLVLAYMALEAWGTPRFWPLLAAMGVAGSALLTNVFFSRVHKAQIEAFQAEQSRLIGELEIARDQADEASRAKTSFLATISHELRTPMHGVLGAAQLLDVAALTPQQKDCVSMIRGSGDALLALLDDLLDFAKIEADRLELEAIPVDLAALVERVTAVWAMQAQAKGLGLRVDADPVALAPIIGDPTRLAQILHNLCSNAVKFTAAGEVLVSVQREALAEARDQLVIAVTDTGPGIAPEDRSKLFTAFGQLDASSTRLFGGTGLGLAISRRLARLMGGDLTVSSTPGVGSTFSLTLEVAAPADGARPSVRQDQELAAGKRLRVLVAEDHPVNRQILQLWLQTQGHDCHATENGELALQAAACERFDVALMDVNMPMMDGLEAVRRLRRDQGPNRSIPIIMLSASARDQDHAAGLAAGADRYLNKPIDFNALSQVLAAIGGPMERTRDEEPTALSLARS